MSTAERLLEFEQGFWKGDVEYFRDMLADGALMVLPEPAGILEHDAILEFIRLRPRWASVDITEHRVLPLLSGATLVTYRAVARHAGEDQLSSALVSSLYVVRDGEWRLRFHQQTPVEPPPLG